MARRRCGVRSACAWSVSAGVGDCLEFQRSIGALSRGDLWRLGDEYLAARKADIAAGRRCRVCELLIFPGPASWLSTRQPIPLHISGAHDGLCAGCAGGDARIVAWSHAAALAEREA